AAKEAPAIAWVGGLLGAFFVASAVTLVPRLGVAMTFSLIIAGQMLVTLVIDHFGLLGVPVKEVSLPRVAGILLITAGVIVIRKF
ncbi:MAG TPA: DMT family transporter, partial [Pyrinomonadaceae bacterium]